MRAQTLLGVLLADAITHYLTAPVRSPRRTHAIQELCATRLAGLGVTAMTEVRVTGAYRTHAWDVYAPADGDLPELAISVRTLATSQAKNLCNRLDDMLAEASNLHRLRPTAVTGFLGFVVASPQESRSVFERFSHGISIRCGRAQIDGPAELFEHGVALWASPEHNLSAEATLDSALRQLANIRRSRALSES